jgi:hypothetical protein
VRDDAERVSGRHADNSDRESMSREEVLLPDATILMRRVEACEALHRNENLFLKLEIER